MKPDGLKPAPPKRRRKKALKINKDFSAFQVNEKKHAP
jgi:hypothetical protein